MILVEYRKKITREAYTYGGLDLAKKSLVNLLNASLEELVMRNHLFTCNITFRVIDPKREKFLDEIVPEEVGLVDFFELERMDLILLILIVKTNDNDNVDQSGSDV